MDSTTHPLAGRISPDSAQALMVWIVLYAQANPGTITPQDMAKLGRGDKYDRKARAVLLLFGIGRA
jgi:hypothetical protein